VTAQPDAHVDRATCSIHTDRQAVARCALCGRATCLACAIPFRGEVLCAGCAAQALGEERPPEEPGPVRDRRPDLVAGGLLVAALALTIPAWHLFGPLNQPLSAWNPTLDAWAAAAGILLVVALIVALVPRLIRIATTRGQAMAYGGLVFFAGLCILRSLMIAPERVQPTATLYLEVAVLVLAAGVALFRIRRTSTPRNPAAAREV
jgi:hypothetical protein